ncbi:MerR family transcriptional regulator [Paenibacillus glycanilyticus]|uniref:MerR family transcriptional regulator n=1 Tax=Paenibacillus glycanilyticus TaxID=126569 RepID=UPI003EBE050C
MYTISQVSAIVALPIVTIRAWEQRYGAIKPLRKDSGHRLYAQSDIDDLLWLKEQKEKGINIAQAVMLLKQRHSVRVQELELQDSDKTLGVPQMLQETLNPCLELQEQLFHSFSRYETEKAKLLLDKGFAVFGYDNMIWEVIVPLMHRVGDKWEEGEISVAQEHYITQLVVQRCMVFLQVFTATRNYPRVLAFCPPGEHHQFGLLLFALYLRQQGAQVIYLGPDTPLEGMIPLIRTQNIHFAAISLNNVNRQPNAVHLIEKLKKEFPMLRFVLGGAGFNGIGEPYRSWWLSGGTQSEWENWFNGTLCTNEAVTGDQVFE